MTLLDPDKRWLLPIGITHLSADASNCGVEFIAIAGRHSMSDEIEGIANNGIGSALRSADTGDKSDHPKIQLREV